MNLPLDSVRAAADREWRRFRELLSSYGEDHWSAPTRLAGWAVRDLAAHAVCGVSMEADALRRRRTATAGRAEGRTVPNGAPREAVLGELDLACRELGEEVHRLTDDDLSSTVPLPYGEIPVVVFSQILVMEAGVHTSDLAAALGQADDLGPDVVQATELSLRLFLPMVAASASERPVPGTTIGLRGETVDLRFRYEAGGWEAVSPSAASDTVATITADDSTVLLFALGRTPASDVRLSISGDEATARSFKLWMPGP